MITCMWSAFSTCNKYKVIQYWTPVITYIKDPKAKVIHTNNPLLNSSFICFIKFAQWVRLIVSILIILLNPVGSSPGATMVLAFSSMLASIISMSALFILFKNKNKGINIIASICTAPLHDKYSLSIVIINPAKVYPRIAPRLEQACKVPSHFVELSGGLNSLTQTGP